MKIIALILVLSTVVICGCSSSNPQGSENNQSSGENYRLDVQSGKIEVVGKDSTADPVAPDLTVKQTNPVSTFTVEPDYPDIAIRAGIKGNAVVRGWVTKSGALRKVQVLKMSADIFMESTLRAAIQYKFKPLTVEGKLVDSWVEFPIEFK